MGQELDLMSTTWTKDQRLQWRTQTTPPIVIMSTFLCVLAHILFCILYFNIVYFIVYLVLFCLCSFMVLICLSSASCLSQINNCLDKVRFFSLLSL